tara:strand:+ start:281 stop:430 length:150 start_codon:yes stop_codon:yes gene_type:complete
MIGKMSGRYKTAGEKLQPILTKTGQKAAMFEHSKNFADFGLDQIRIRGL